MSYEFPERVKKVLDFISDVANRYTGHDINYREYYRTKAHIIDNKQLWRSISEKEVEQYLIEKGVSNQSAKDISKLIKDVKNNKKIRKKPGFEAFTI